MLLVVVIDVRLAEHLGVVHPEIDHQFRVGRVDTGVQDGDDDAPVAGLDVPGLGRVDVRVFAAPRLARVVQRPLIDVLRVVGRAAQRVFVVGFRIQDVFAGAELGQGVHHRPPFRQPHAGQALHQAVVFLLDRRPLHDGPGDPLAHRARSPGANQVGTRCGRTVSVYETNEQRPLLLRARAVVADRVRQ